MSKVPMFRDLTASEVECRISMVKENGLSLLLYKNARCDMNILDETVGAEKWQRRHYECKGNLFCEIGIKCGDEWIWKGDCGTESYSEKEKGEASDSFKRAGFNWGIGRELYTAPFIWVKSDLCNIKVFNGKATCSDRFIVKYLKVENKEITQLAIYNNTKKTDCFTFGLKAIPKPDESRMLKADIDFLLKQAEEKGITAKMLCKRFKVSDLMDLTPEQYEICRAGLEQM